MRKFPKGDPEERKGLLAEVVYYISVRLVLTTYTRVGSYDNERNHLLLTYLLVFHSRYPV